MSSSVAAPDTLAVTLADLSQRARFGCKGAAAEAFLSSLGLPLPASPNAWTVDDAGRLVARLATSEFLVEASGFEQARVANIAAELYDPSRRRPGLVPVPRQDFVVELAGPRANDVLRQTCNVNFAALTSAVTRGAGALVLTMMIGVGVTVVPRVGPHGASLTIWTDPSFSHYLWSMLADITKGLGGGILASWGDGREAP
jgi:heterotetrameric sarcosine oxidase gamma subunit